MTRWIPAFVIQSVYLRLRGLAYNNLFELFKPLQLETINQLKSQLTQPNFDFSLGETSTDANV
ncbi:MAG: hypothetical protein SVX43_02380 [Cyanobacteriota bacterium]|nr:hypothetical protein [Cyanobacteriota bacterium]